MESQNLRQQIKNLQQDAEDMVKSITRGVAQKAKKMLVEEQEKIITDFYQQYPREELRSYDRQEGLKNTLIGQHCTQVHSRKMSYMASIVVSSKNMEDHYGAAKRGITQDNIFDLMWNHGVRGLPRVSTKSDWENPYWDPTIYHNTFRTLDFNRPPHMSMIKYIESWGKIGGSVCDDVIKELGYTGGDIKWII